MQTYDFGYHMWLLNDIWIYHYDNWMIFEYIEMQKSHSRLGKIHRHDLNLAYRYLKIKMVAYE